MTADWRGEHLIRARQPEAGASGRDTRGGFKTGSMVARKKREVCPVQGCGRKLYVNSATGLCRDHNHARGLCQCSTCTNRGSR